MALHCFVIKAGFLMESSFICCSEILLNQTECSQLCGSCSEVQYYLFLAGDWINTFLTISLVIPHPDNVLDYQKSHDAFTLRNTCCDFSNNPKIIDKN